MSDLRPVGVPVMIEGVERHMLFTLNVIDEMQEHYNEPLAEIINNLMKKSSAVKTLRYMTYALLEDELQRKAAGGEKLKKYSEKEIGWLITRENEEEIMLAILKAYGLALPESDDEEEMFPNQSSGQAVK